MNFLAGCDVGLAPDG